MNRLKRLIWSLRYNLLKKMKYPLFSDGIFQIPYALSDLSETQIMRIDLRHLANTDPISFEMIRLDYLSSGSSTPTGSRNNEKPFEFQCNICGKKTSAPLQKIQDRESSSCEHCGSNLRMRSITHLLSTALFGKSLTIPDFPVERGIVGIGMSDRDEFASQLSEKLAYTNTYLQKEPKLDILSIRPEQNETCDFIISSDIFEHVPNPVEKAFENLNRLLKPGGLCIFTVPYKNTGQTREHFPDLYDFRFIETHGKTFLFNVTRKGEEQIFDNLRFHGGSGATLEMRLFSRDALKDLFMQSNFESIRFNHCQVPEYGILWSYDWDLPITAQKSAPVTRYKATKQGSSGNCSVE